MEVEGEEDEDEETLPYDEEDEEDLDEADIDGDETMGLDRMHVHTVEIDGGSGAEEAPQPGGQTARRTEGPPSSADRARLR